MVQTGTPTKSFNIILTFLLDNGYVEFDSLRVKQFGPKRFLKDKKYLYITPQGTKFLETMNKTLSLEHNYSTSVSDRYYYNNHHH